MWRQWIGLAVLALPTFVVAIDLFVLLVALPGLSSALGAGSVEQLWITDVYGFLLAGFTLPMGSLGDRIGRRRLLLIGAVAFGLASLACAYATSVGMLIAARAVLGIAGATIGPSTLALIGGLFAGERQRAAAFGVWGGVYTLGALVGPVIGGVLLARFWWGSVFLLGPPVMAVAVVLALWVLPRDVPVGAERLDLRSLVLSLLAVLPLVYAIKEFARYGPATAPAVAAVVGLGSCALFTRTGLGRRLGGLLRDRVIAASLAAQLAFSGFGAGFNLLLVLYFQLVAGMSTLQTGLAMVPGMVTAALAFQLAPRLAASVAGPATVIAAGLAVEAAVLLAFTQVPASAAVLVAVFALTAFGVPAVGLGTNLVVASAPPERMGLAGSVAQLANEFGGMLGIALYGTLASVVYRARVPASSGDSLAGTTARGAALDQARDAFVAGMHTVAAVGAVLLVVAALLVMSTRRVRR